jgi:hypothetical protein
MKTNCATTCGISDPAPAVAADTPAAATPAVDTPAVATDTPAAAVVTGVSLTDYVSSHGKTMEGYKTELASDIQSQKSRRDSLELSLNNDVAEKEKLDIAIREHVITFKKETEAI